MYLNKLLVAVAAVMLSISPALAGDNNATGVGVGIGNASVDAGNPLALGAASIGGASGVNTTVVGPFGVSRPDGCSLMMEQVAFAREYGRPYHPDTVRAAQDELCPLKTQSVTRKASASTKNSPHDVVPFEPKTYKVGDKTLTIDTMAKHVAFHDCNRGLRGGGMVYKAPSCR